MAPQENTYVFQKDAGLFFSRIDTIWISRDLATRFSKVEILPREVFANRNPVSLVYKRKSSSFRGTLNDVLL